MLQPVMMPCNPFLKIPFQKPIVTAVTMLNDGRHGMPAQLRAECTSLKHGAVSSVTQPIS